MGLRSLWPSFHRGLWLDQANLSNNALGEPFLGVLFPTPQSSVRCPLPVLPQHPGHTLITASVTQTVSSISLGVP